MRYRIRFDTETWLATPDTLHYLLVTACAKSSTGNVSVERYS